MMEMAEILPLPLLQFECKNRLLGHFRHEYEEERNIKLFESIILHPQPEGAPGGHVASLHKV